MPPLLASREPPAKSPAKGKRKAEAEEHEVAIDAEVSQEPVNAKWISLENMDAKYVSFVTMVPRSIDVVFMLCSLCSTAMLKVWNQAKTLWASRS